MHFSHYDRRRLRLIAAQCRGPHVLDLGYARSPNPFLARFHTVGLDLKRPDAKSPYAEELVGDAIQLDQHLSGRQFDTIIAGELIEHLERPYDFVRQLRLFLSRGGRVVISTPNPLGFPVIFAEYVRSRRVFYTHNHVYYFAPRWLARVLEHSGFRIISTRGVGLWSPLITIPCPVPLSYQVIYTAEPGIER